MAFNVLAKDTRSPMATICARFSYDASLEIHSQNVWHTTDTRSHFAFVGQPVDIRASDDEPTNISTDIWNETQTATIRISWVYLEIGA